MAAGPFRSLRIIIFGVCTIVSKTYAAPIVALPFNSQVPTVARVGQAYNFQFSPSTFAPEDVSYTYSLSNQPGWLSLDGSNRTLSGTPSQADVGAADFIITAASIDGATHMSCTLVVSKNPPPQMEGDISEQLAATVNLSSSHPPSIAILASSPFHFQFKQGSFIDIVKRKLYYYATLTDHTPLPSWLMFDVQSLTFSGFAPPFAALPQSWNVELIASDVEGFAATSTSFTIVIGTQQLVFVPEQQVITITAGEFVKYTGLQNTLFRGGVRMALEDLGSANASVPSWLHFDSSTLALTGTAPKDVTDLNITVGVSDKKGYQASALIRLVTGSSTLFSGTVGTLIAHTGEDFNYQFPTTLFTSSDVQVQVVLPVTAKWLRFDEVNRRLSGKVPALIGPSLLEGKVTATSNATHQSQTQTFTINIVSSSIGSTASHTLATGTSAATPGTAVDEDESHAHLSSGVVAAVVLGCLLAAAVLAACLVLLRRRKRRQSYVETTGPTRRTISRPILPSEPGAITVTTELQNDIEKTADGGNSGTPAKEAQHAPQIALNLPVPPPCKRFKWSKRFSRISHDASSLGNGEDAVRADSNIPEWGTASTSLHNPHESFSVPAEMARSSRQLSQLSPGKRALKRLQKRRQPSVQSIGLGIDTGGTNMLPRPSSHGARSHRRAGSSIGRSAATDRSSAASFSTRGTSVLSTKTSDFPRPPTRSTFGGSRSIPKSSMTEAERRRSIRVVDRSDSIADDRSLQEKRQSFIRNRASASFASPLFAHGARVISGTRQNGRTSLNGLSVVDHRRSQRGNSQLTTYSESSSLEPPPRDPRRLSARVRSAFAPNFPRAITKSTLGADNDGAVNGDTSSFYTTSSSISEKDYTAEMALPRNERSWVLPGEASPTPPPGPPTSRQGSGAKKSTAPNRAYKPRQKWQERLREHSSSPLSTALAVPLADRRSLSASARVSQARRSKISEPMSLVSNDSLSRTKPERPRLVHANSRRPVSIEKVQRLSSFKAETDDARPGSEMFEALEEAGLMPPSVADGKETSQKSNFSGPAFL